MKLSEVFEQVLGAKDVPKRKRAKRLRQVLDIVEGREAKLEKALKKAEKSDAKDIEAKLDLYAKHRKKAKKVLKKMEK